MGVKELHLPGFQDNTGKTVPVLNYYISPKLNKSTSSSGRYIHVTCQYLNNNYAISFEQAIRVRYP